jgi:hypothetical protein
MFQYMRSKVESFSKVERLIEIIATSGAKTIASRRGWDHNS